MGEHPSRPMKIANAVATRAAFKEWWEKVGEALYVDGNTSTHDLVRLAYWDATLRAHPEFAKTDSD